MALTGRKKPTLGQKKAANNFFDADHHFEPHKIAFKKGASWITPVGLLVDVEAVF